MQVKAYLRTDTQVRLVCVLAYYAYLCVSKQVRIVCKYASTHSMQVHTMRTCILCSLHTYNAGSDPIQPNSSEPLYKFPQVYMSIMYITMLGGLQVSVHANMHICPFVFKHNNHHNHRCVSLCVCVYLSVCVHLSQQVTCRCSLFNLAGLGENQVTSQTLFSQHTSHSKKCTHHDANSSWRKMTLLWGVSAIFCHLNQWQFESVPSIKNLFCSCNGGSWFFFPQCPLVWHFNQSSSSHNGCNCLSIVSTPKVFQTRWSQLFCFDFVQVFVWQVRA